MQLAAYPPPAPPDPTAPPPPGVRFTPNATLSIEGVGAEHLGPEAAGAVTVLCGALADPEKADSFWHRAMGTGLAAREHPGFVRLLGFADGIMLYALILWRSKADADAFAAGGAHQEASRAQHQTGEQYNHFAGTFVADQPRRRHVHCDRCGTRATLPADTCESCGNRLVDAFEFQAKGDAATA